MTTDSIRTPEVSRRGFLEWFLGGLALILGGGLLGPALAYLWPSTQKGPVQQREEAGAAADWAVSASKKLVVNEKPLIVIRTSAGFRSFSAVCPHLGCLITWNASRQMFECPCHGATFNTEGKVTAGPPPRPLTEFSVTVADGKVFVSA